jgi:hypothetical protein
MELKITIVISGSALGCREVFALDSEIHY